jgi:hypothetical protein
MRPNNYFLQRAYAKKRNPHQREFTTNELMTVLIIVGVFTCLWGLFALCMYMAEKRRDRNQQDVAVEEASTDVTRNRRRGPTRRRFP